jgi:hypothetical protein
MAKANSINMMAKTKKDLVLYRAQHWNGFKGRQFCRINWYRTNINHKGLRNVDS